MKFYEVDRKSKRFHRGIESKKLKDV